MTPHEVERALARIANEHPEHREVLDRAGQMLLRMSAMIGLIQCTLKSGRGVKDLTE